MYVGFSKDNQTIVYNEHFSKFILSKSISLDNKSIKTELLPAKVKVVGKNNTQKINDLLDKLNRFGINSITPGEKNQLDNLSRFLK